MKKDDLIAMGLTEEQAKKVMEALDGSYVTKTRFNEVNEENKTLKGTIADRDTQLETLKNSSGDNEKLKEDIEKLQEDNKKMAETHAAEIAQLKLDNAFDAALMTAGAKNVKIARGAFDITKLKLDENGKLTGFDEQLKAAQKSDAYLFEEKQKAPTFKGVEPGASGDVKPGTNVDMSKMTYEELSVYIDNNPDAVN